MILVYRVVVVAYVFESGMNFVAAAWAPHIVEVSDPFLFQDLLFLILVGIILVGMIRVSSQRFPLRFDRQEYLEV